MKRKLITAAVIVILILILLLQNYQVVTEVVTVRLYFWEISVSQIILIPLTMMVGFVLGFIVAKLTGKNRKIKGKDNLTT
jgi:uncharacterized integral membrane protein